MKTSTTSKRQFKDAIYDQFARIGKAVSSPKRLELLDLLCQGERTVEALAAEAELSIANTSQHLQVLRAARLVEASKEGLYVTYRIADSAVGEFVRSIRVLAEKQLAEVEQISRRFFEARQDLEPIDRDALVKRVAKGRGGRAGCSSSGRVPRWTHPWCSVDADSRAETTPVRAPEKPGDRGLLPWALLCVF